MTGGGQTWVGGLERYPLERFAHPAPEGLDFASACGVAVAMIGIVTTQAMGMAGLTPAGEIGAGAVVGALVIAAAYLAGFAVFRRSAAAVCALLMVIAAGILEFSALGLLVVPSPHVLVLFEGLFGATALVFLSAVIRPARNNALLGGLMFAAALSLLGLGVLNLIAKGDGAGLMRIGVIGVGVFAVFLAAIQAPRDLGARLILPGALIALAAPFAGNFLSGPGAAIAPHILFTLGILGASLVALTETRIPRLQEIGLHQTPKAEAAETPAEQAPAVSQEERLLVSENQLAQVLDYNGVAVWDWSPAKAHQTESLPTLMGADTRGVFSPEAMREFVHKDDAAKFGKRVLGEGEPHDAAFDCVLRMRDGRPLRFRGARAVDAAGVIERLVAFIESAPEAAKSKNGETAASFDAAGSKSASPLTRTMLESAFADALANGEIGVAFQPIVELEGGRVVGFEALARWRDKDGKERAGAEALVRAAEGAGKGGALAEFVLAAAAAHLSAAMKAKGRRDLFVAMNLSFAQMREPGFAAALKKAMKDFDLPAKSLVLELTESQEITDTEAAGVIFGEMKAAGAALAFDDFGSGFTSLRNLQRFAFDYLKIDKSFIDGLAADGDASKIAGAVAGLGRDLGLTVIAEGVETKETAEAARAVGCAYGQGFAFGEPVLASGAPSEEQREREQEPAMAGGPSSENKWRGKLR